MATKPEPEAAPAISDDQKSGDKATEKKRDIKGGIPYSTSPGVFRKALELAIAAERPEKFSSNYMATILKLTGGSARAVPPLLKKMQFIGSDGTPTTLYSKFKTDGGRAQAAYEGLRNSFGELFRRNEYVHKADESTVRDLLVEITGLKKNDHIIRMMYQTFDAIRSFINTEVAGAGVSEPSPEGVSGELNESGERAPARLGGLGLSYQINIVLPETDNISVFNAIFRSLRDNLLQ